MKGVHKTSVIPTFCFCRPDVKMQLFYPVIDDQVDRALH